MKVKTFIKALSYFPDNLKAFEKCLSDNRLTLAEKDLLKIMLSIRDSKYENLLSKLSKLKTDDPVIESQKFNLIGIIYLNTGHFQLAVQPFSQCLELLKNFDLEERIFTTYFHLFLVYLNLRDSKGMAHMLDEMQGLKPKESKEKINLYRAQFNYYAFMGEMNKAKTCLRQIDSLSPSMNEAQKTYFLTDKFDFYIKSDDLKACEEVLSEMKKFRKFQLTANYKFMRKLMDFYHHNKPLYLYPQDFKDQGILYHQVNVLLNLECGHSQNAYESWKQLQHISHNVYHDDFFYQGEKNIFQLVLEKIKNKQIQVESDLSFDLLGVEKNCFDILKNGKPISQDELFLQIWNTEPSTKDELARLRKVISRLRSKIPYIISSKKGTYHLEIASDSSKKSA